ncbi:hypothetical protein [Maritimibacter sp. UBA3975]|mgnify:CR=1 FL=1|uniref:hypothetical protein n=1 Tax=Maritimibacter sp. UBA3975 TaxID=1946833 RepID=UPI000C09562D|nr:hypothetical protein [Maritimibacter sp. UBA3975]MAM62095.1 hypothetical protein [Maritimibacter sp.]|tara:strand:- start:259 stop:606 length:348 start_codon:yes stop_codon:yes gene_type:complete
MSDEIDDQARAERERITDTAQTELDALEAGVIPLRRLVNTWAIRVFVFAIIVIIVARVTGSGRDWVIPAIAIYGAFSLALAFLMRHLHRNSIDKTRARITAASDSLDRELDRRDD